jgi:hypothetical protein
VLGPEPLERGDPNRAAHVVLVGAIARAVLDQLAARHQALAVDDQLLERRPDGSLRLQLRAESINAFNQAYFPNPVAAATSATLGQVTASNQENYARRAQIGVKILF